MKNMNQPVARSTKGDGKKKTKHIVVLLIILIFLLGAVLTLILMQNNGKPSQERYWDTEAEQGLVAGRSPEEIQALLDQIVEEGMFNISINGQITVGTDRKGDVCIENIPSNQYLMQVRIIVTDSGGTQVTVYQSGMLRPGYSIETGTFQVLPPVGYTDALAVFTALDPDTLEEVGQTQAAIILIREIA